MLKGLKKLLFYLRFFSGIVALLLGSRLDVLFVATDRGCEGLVPAVRRVAFVTYNKTKKSQISYMFFITILRFSFQ